MKYSLYSAATYLLLSCALPASTFAADLVVDEIKTIAPPTIIDNGPPKMVKFQVHGVAQADGTLQSEWKAFSKRKVLNDGELGQQSLSAGDEYKLELKVPIVAVNGTLFYVKDMNEQRALRAYRELGTSAWWTQIYSLDELILKVYQLLLLDKAPAGVQPPPVQTTINGVGNKILDITVIINKGGGGSDPHFKTWSGKKFDYHGECDLVLFSDDKAASGLGLDVHIRTTIVNDYSYISNAAVRIGADVLEVTSDGSFFLNYAQESEVPKDISGFPLEYNNKEDGSIEYNVHLGGGEVVSLRAYKGFLWASVSLARKDELVGHASGLMGSYPMGEFVGRDMSTVHEDPVVFSEEWQVRDTEAMLFHEVRAPQYPQRCILPSDAALARRHRRLRGNDFAEKAAAACEKWGADKEDCLFDVLATGDLDLADVGLL